MAKDKQVQTVDELLELWAEHGKGYVRSAAPRGVGKRQEMLGLSMEEQAAAFVANTRGYSAAHPVLWWTWMRERPLADFDLGTYVREHRREKARNGQHAEELAGWRGVPGRKPETIYAEFRAALKEKLETEPLVVFSRYRPGGSLEELDRITLAVNEAARRRWGRQ
jgi:hypothetical protein